MLPQVAQIAFNNALKNIDLTAYSAKLWLAHAYIPGAFVTPTFLNIPSVTSKINTAAVQMMMLTHISKLFNIKYTK